MSSFLDNIELGLELLDEQPVFLRAVYGDGSVEERKREGQRAYTSSRKCSLRVSMEVREIIETSSSFSSTEGRISFGAELEGGELLTVTTVLLRALVRGVLNLDGDSSSGLVLLDHVLDLVVDLKRGAAKRERRDQGKSWKMSKEPAYTLPSEMISFFLVSGSVRMTQRGVPTRRLPSLISQPTMMAVGER